MQMIIDFFVKIKKGHAIAYPRLVKKVLSC